MRGNRVVALVARAAILSLAASFPAVALATDTIKVGKVGAWEVRIDPTMRNGCFVMRGYEESGLVLRVGFDPEIVDVYMFFLQDDWKSIEKDKRYAMRATFDGGRAHDVEMVGDRLAGTPILALRAPPTDFFKDFVARNVMTLSYRGAQLARVSLEGTNEAMFGMAACQDGVNARKANKDPFR